VSYARFLVRVECKVSGGSGDTFSASILPFDFKVENCT